MIEKLWQDLRHAFRALRRSPGFSAAVVITLGLGIGANTAVFGVVDGVLLHPVPFPAPDRLVAVYSTNANTAKNSLSYPNFEDLHRDSSSFEALAAWRTHAFTLTGGGEPQALFGKMISAELLDVVGVPAVAGRTFRQDEDRLGATPVVMLGEDFWRTHFRADSTILGQSLILNGRAHTVVGIAPSILRLTRGDGSFLNDVYVPIGQYDDPLFRRRGVSNGTVGLGRLRNGVSLSAARTAAGVVAARLEQQYPDANRGVGINVVSLGADVAGDLRPTVTTLFGAVGLVLLITSANAGHLMLVRSTARRHELAVRAALGAGERTLVWQVLVEALVLSSLGGTTGLVLAAWLTRAGLAMAPDVLPAMSDVGLNWRVLAFTFGIVGLTTLLLGVLPGVRAARAGVRDQLADRSRTAQGVKAGWQRALVVAQVSLTLVLLVAAGLLTRSLVRVLAVDPGIDPTGVLTFRTALSTDMTATPTAIRAAFRQLDERLARVPGVVAASVDIGAPPFRGGSTSLGFWRADQPPPTEAREEREAIFHAVGPDHFRAMGTPLLRGRSFTRFDDERSASVAIVDEEFASSVFPGEDVVGQRIRLAAVEGTWEIVGVVRHVRHWGLDSDETARVRAQLYLPYAQIPDVIAPLAAGAIGGVVRTTDSPASVVSAVRRELTRFDPNQAMRAERTMTDVLETSLAGRRFSATLLGAFAVLALTLALVGTYALIAYVITQRTAEIGIRVALGARPANIVQMLVGDGQRMVAGGLLVGLPAAYGAAHLIGGQLYGVTSSDAFTFAAVVALLVGTNLGACLLAARRATRIDPLEALRQS
jgi:predicted permease